jgi:hypothetical protein
MVSMVPGSRSTSTARGTYRPPVGTLSDAHKTDSVRTLSLVEVHLGSGQARVEHDASGNFLIEMAVDTNTVLL